MCVELSDFGALVLSVYVLDRHGRNRDVVLGYDNLTDYYEQDTGFGAYIGRNANRIAGAEVTIEGTKYLLDKMIIKITFTVVLTDRTINFTA